MRWAVLVMLAACYRPTPEAGAPCSAEGACPTPLACVAGVCTTGGGSGSSGGQPDAPLAQDGPLAPDGLALDARADAMSGTDAAASDAGGDPSLVLHYTMEDDPSDGTIDVSGHHPAACAGGCPTRVAGELGSGFHFAGDQMLVPGSDATDLEPGTGFTISVWLRPTAKMPNGGLIAGRYGLALDTSYALAVSSDAAPVVEYLVAGITYTAGTHPLALGTWHHVAMTWDGSTRTGYVDGASDGSAAVSASDSSNSSFGFGAATTILGLDATYTGDMDELRFYTRALSATEIAALATP